MTIGNIELTPTFNTDTTEYSGNATNASDVITATPISIAANVDIVANGSMVENGQAIKWNQGTNEVSVVVSTGSAVKTYNITINKG